MATIKSFEDFLDRMQGLLDNAKKQGHIIVRVEDLENAFPELKESEDEKIRKELIRMVKEDWPGRKDVIAWLEKQCEQKPQGKSALEAAKEEKIDNANKAEPKFKVGDWICHTVYKKPLLIVEDLGEGDFRTEPKSIITAKEFREGVFRLWTIQDAKAGDVLADGNLPFIFKKIDTNKYSYAYCGISVDDGFKIESEGKSGEWTWMQDIKPATKEQRYLLFQKMNEAGYEWDANKRELKKIEQKSSEEYNITGIGSKNAQGKLGEMIKKLKPVNEVLEQKPWSEEDEKQARQIERIVHNDGCTQKLQKQIADWFKSLKERVQPQLHWKPSDEQMEALNDVISSRDIKYDVLSELWKDLKK